VTGAGNPYNGRTENTRTENARTENTRMENARSMLQKMPELENTRIGKWQNKNLAEQKVAELYFLVFLSGLNLKSRFNG